MSRERKPQQHPSAAEWKVLHALWRKHPANARELLEALRGETGWAYTTLKTVLSRMVEKGLVSAEMRRNTTWYEPAVERHRARRKALRHMIERVFEGAVGPLLAHLVEDETLSRSERKHLAALIEEVEKNEARRG